MHVMTGTSGFSYAAWRGSFYPEEAAPRPKMLAFYAGKLGAVEINSTFYRLPNASLLERWAAATPGSFRFALKSPRGITHMRRLAARATGSRGWRSGRARSAIGWGRSCFSCPRRCARIWASWRRSWRRCPPACARRSSSGTSRGSPTTCTRCCRRHDAALCVADSEEFATPFVATAGWGYLRLRRQDYDKAALRRWAKRLRAQSYDDAYVFFKHEAEGAGPALADSFRSMMI